MDINIILWAFATSLYFLAPAYFSNGAALAFGGGKPVDFGKMDKKGRRWIGDGVTWRGLIAGTLIGTLTGIVQGYLNPDIISEVGQYIITPIIPNMMSGIIIGFLLGFGAVLGDAIGSFIKRRIGIERGKQAPLLDQLDFLIMALILVAFVVNLNWIFIIISIILTLIIHSVANILAYLLGIKDVWY